jgi:AI-2 transport protein TqsA
MSGDDKSPEVRVDVREGGSRSLRNACVFMAVVVGVFTVMYFRAILTPLVIAVFLLLLIDGFSRTMLARFPGWPGWWRYSLGAMLTIAGFAVVVGVCVKYGRSFAAELLIIQPKVDMLLTQVSQELQIAPVSVRDLFRGNLQSAIRPIIAAAEGVLSGAVLVIIYLGFLMASRQAFGKKAEKMFAAGPGREHADRVFSRVRTASEQYIGLQTLKAALLAASAWLIMTFVGVREAPFLAFLLFLAAYVPIVGGFVGAIIPSLLAWAQFESPLRPLVLLLLLASTIFLIENVLMPKIQSDRLNVDPVVVLVSLGFWGMILGVPGALLSTPLTVVVIAVASEFQGARWLALLLSKEGELATV